MLTNEEKTTIAQRVREILRSDQSHEEESKLFASLTAQYGQPEELDELIKKELDGWLEESNYCPHCGEPSPEPFLAPDPVWQFYVERGFRREHCVWRVLKRLSPKKMAAFLRENTGRLPAGRAVIRCRTAATKSFGK
jgi:hypothetical protein